MGGYTAIPACGLAVLLTLENKKTHHKTPTFFLTLTLTTRELGLKGFYSLTVSKQKQPKKR